MKTRIITAAVLLPLLLIVLWFLPTLVMALVFGALSAAAAYELLYGTNMVTHPRMVAYSMVMAFMVSLWCYFGQVYAWAVLGILVFLAALFGEMMASHVKVRFDMLAMCVAAGLLLPFLFTSLVRIQCTAKVGRYLILIPFIMAFLSDSGAYFAGRAFGQHKLSPTISPNKTVEGVVGGILGAMAGMVLYTLILQLAFAFEVNYLYALVYGLVGALGSTFGDLCFSVIKRQTGIKDYGKIFPGHGGVLDRFDSMMIVGPLAETLLILIPLAV